MAIIGPDPAGTKRTHSPVGSSHGRRRHARPASPRTSRSSAPRPFRRSSPVAGIVTTDFGRGVPRGLAAGKRCLPELPLRLAPAASTEAVQPGDSRALYVAGRRGRQVMTAPRTREICCLKLIAYGYGFDPDDLHPRR